MCLQQTRTCHCGRHTAYLSFRDNILTPETLLHLYCPECRSEAAWDTQSMVEDCGWILEYDLDMAQVLFRQRGLARQADAACLFDEGYLTWQGFSPLDHEVNAALHKQLEPLIRENLPRYLELLKTEWLAHVAQLKAAGWRKAQQA